MRRRGAGLALALVCAAAMAHADDPFLRRTATVEVVQEVGPTVVNITTERIVAQRNPFGQFSRNPMFEQFFRDFFEPRLPQTMRSLGSGVVIDPEGHILTNEHVVARASRIHVSMGDGREFEATLIGADPNNDIAVLKAETEEGLPWTPPGSSADLLVGEPVIAIGNPFGLSSTVTTGVISAVNRSVRTESRVFHGFLQTDASINPGNSGGPLLNAEGKLIAINTAVYQGGQGIGFAIPIDTAKRVVSELIAHGEVTPVWIGLDFQNLAPALREAMRLPPGVRGVLVNRVREQSPAHRAGVLRGDVVTQLDRRPVETARGFFEMLETVTVNQDLEIRLWREGSSRTAVLRAEEIPDERVAQFANDLLGMQLQLRKRAGNFVVRSVRGGSGAARIGIQPGDLVLGINGRRLDTEDALRRSVLELRGRERAMIVVQRGAGRYHVTIPLV
jgi:serine protease Do